MKTKQIVKKGINFKKVSELLLILLIELIIVNLGSGLHFKFATKDELKASADVIQNFIVSEYKRQGDKADLKEIVSRAKKLDEYGLSINYVDYGVHKYFIILKAQDPEPLVLDEFDF